MEAWDKMAGTRVKAPSMYLWSLRATDVNRDSGELEEVPEVGVHALHQSVEMGHSLLDEASKTVHHWH